MTGGRPAGAVASLRRQWRGAAVAAAAVAAVGFLLLSDWWTPEHGGRWVSLSGVVMTCELGVLRRWLDRNRGPGDRLYPTLGVPTTLTLLRGLLVAVLAGFLILPRPAGAAGWLPAALYGGAIGLDLVDGALARRLDRTTPLGASMDTAVDTLGLVVAPLLAVAYGQLPVWYLAVSAARPAFLAGVTARRRAGLPVGALPASETRRRIAALQMGVVAVALSPAVGPPATTALAAVAAAPHLFGFARDWLVVTGRRGGG